MIIIIVLRERFFFLRLFFWSKQLYIHSADLVATGENVMEYEGCIFEPKIVVQLHKKKKKLGVKAFFRFNKKKKKLNFCRVIIIVCGC